ncbi:F-box only protein 36b [Eucyclogobius newberryi]|uniref:F-box only protein 36b n=1 Tax=Eucyclogobius newberryi TaxID=166745 RepID=UPI003B5C7519
MASLLTDPLFEISGIAPAPNKSFYYLGITQSEVIWRWWKISLRTSDRNTRPGELKESHMEMLEDARLQADIATVFGPEVLDHVKRLCQGQMNFLELLPDALLLRILSLLELEDVGQLMHTSRRFWKLCQSQEFWENAVRQRCSTLPDEVGALARHIGWRRIFFTDKIKLQLLVNRHRAALQEADQSAHANSDK